MNICLIIIRMQYLIKNYKEELKDVDLLLFVSCWHGMKNNDWRGMTSKEGVNRVIEVFQYAKSLKLKTIFQTIEDPSNYNVFLPIANEADYIFTTAAEMISKYIEDTENKNVFLLDYGVNPQFHNPVGFKNKEVKKKNNVFFAGSWAPRYKERCDDSIILFDGVIESNKGLILADISIVKLMDNKLQTGSSDIIPVCIKKDGTISESKSSVINKENFDKLQLKVKDIIKEISKEILSGKINIRPYNYNKKTGCDYCKYKTICMFNTNIKDNEYNFV